MPARRIAQVKLPGTKADFALLSGMDLAILIALGTRHYGVDVAQSPSHVAKPMTVHRKLCSLEAWLQPSGLVNCITIILFSKSLAPTLQHNSIYRLIAEWQVSA